MYAKICMYVENYVHRSYVHLNVYLCVCVCVCTKWAHCYFLTHCTFFFFWRSGRVCLSVLANWKIDMKKECKSQQSAVIEPIFCIIILFLVYNAINNVYVHNLHMYLCMMVKKKEKITFLTHTHTHRARLSSVVLELYIHMYFAVCMHMCMCFQLVFVASPLLSFEAAKNFSAACLLSPSQQRWRRPLLCTILCVLCVGFLPLTHNFNNFKGEKNSKKKTACNLPFQYYCYNDADAR